MQDEPVIFLKVFDMTEEEKSGALKIINQLVEQTDEKLCVATDEGDIVALDTYNMTIEESDTLLDFIQETAHTYGYKFDSRNMS